MNAQQNPQTGTKHDAQKPQPALVLHSMSRAIQAVVEVATFGAGKYSPDNWLLVPDGISRYRNAKLRHMLDSSTESHDPESGLLHAAHEAWNALAVLELMLRGAQAAPAEVSPGAWDAAEERMDAIGLNGNDGAHYSEAGFIDGHGTIEVGDHLPELGGYLIGFIGDSGIIMPEVEFSGLSFYEGFATVAELNTGRLAGGGGFSDWHVPTAHELNLAWINRAKLAGLGMTQDTYWSATGHTAGALCQKFGNGLQGRYYKSRKFRVRPVRSVPITAMASTKE